MAGDAPHPDDERQIEAAERERRRLESDHAPREGHTLDEVRRAMRDHDRDSEEDAGG